MPKAVRLADLLIQGTEKVAAMVGLLRQLSKASDRLMGLTMKLNQLENEADLAYEQAIARLFQQTPHQYWSHHWRWCDHRVFSRQMEAGCRFCSCLAADNSTNCSDLRNFLHYI